jgi:hypothetical protein
VVQRSADDDVSDALLRDDDRSDKELTHLLYSLVSEQMPEHFNIVPLPSKIVSWLTSQLQRLPAKEQLSKKRKRTKIGRGGDGSSTATPLESPPTSTLISLKSQTDNQDHRSSRRCPSRRTLFLIVSLTFRDNDQPNPTRDEDGELGRLLSRLFQTFRAKDPAEKQYIPN